MQLAGIPVGDVAKLDEVAEATGAAFGQWDNAVTRSDGALRNARVFSLCQRSEHLLTG